MAKSWHTVQAFLLSRAASTAVAVQSIVGTLLAIFSHCNNQRQKREHLRGLIPFKQRWHYKIHIQNIPHPLLPFKTRTSVDLGLEAWWKEPAQMVLQSAKLIASLWCGLQQLVFSNISIPAPSIGTRGELSKVYGMDYGGKSQGALRCLGKAHAKMKGRKEKKFSVFMLNNGTPKTKCQIILGSSISHKRQQKSGPM